MTTSNTIKRPTLMDTAAAARIQSAATSKPSCPSAKTGFAPRAQRAAAANLRRGRGRGTCRRR
jgi:hypothetical protein